LKRRKLIKH